MLNLPKIAVTGGLACGKSTVCRLFQELGARTVSADEIVHELLNVYSDTGREIIRELGEEILTEGQIDREKMGQIVFRDVSKLQKLESILHPQVGVEIKRAYEEAAETGSYPLFIAEIPLLFESQVPLTFDSIITVASDPDVAVTRYKGPSKDFYRRQALQMALEKKMKKSNFTLFNNGSELELKIQVQKLFNQLKKS